jgi:hypothetical protein
MKPDISKLVGLVFYDSELKREYGAIRPIEGEVRSPSPSMEPFAEDECGNLFVVDQNGKIHFWDHEVDELILLAGDFEWFTGNCVKLPEVKLKDSDVESAWIDPEFAKSLGIDAPKHGWKKKAK